MPFVYILKSFTFNKTNVGSTIDLNKRLKEHNLGKSKFTKKYTPWQLVYYEIHDGLDAARKREKYFKSAAGRKYIKKNNIIPR